MRTKNSYPYENRNHKYLSNKINLENTSDKFRKYSSIYRDLGLDAAVKQLNDDGKDANWIMHYRNEIFSDRTRTEVGKAIKAAEKDKGMER